MTQALDSDVPTSAHSAFFSFQKQGVIESSTDLFKNNETHPVCCSEA